MKLAALMDTDIWFHRLMFDAEQGRLDSQVLVDVPVENTVLVNSVTLEFEGFENKYRPYLLIAGRLLASHPQTEMPYGIDEFTFMDTENRPAPYMSFRYDFNDEQLADMIMMGFYESEFQVPSEMVNIPWEFPGLCDYFIASPATYEQVPIAFVTIKDHHKQALDRDSSGYALEEYFPDLRPQKQSEAEVHADLGIELDSLETVFGDIELENIDWKQLATVSREQEQVQVDMGDVSSSLFAQLVADAGKRAKRRKAVVKATLPQEVSDYETEAEVLYRERIEREIAEARAAQPDIDLESYGEEFDPDAVTEFDPDEEEYLHPHLRLQAEEEAEDEDVDLENEFEVKQYEKSQEDTNAALRERAIRELDAADEIAEDFANIELDDSVKFE